MHCADPEILRYTRRATQQRMTLGSCSTLTQLAPENTKWCTSSLLDDDDTA